MKKISLWQIYKVFFMLGVELLGGGYVIVPLINKYMVEKRQWITNDELCNFYALSQSLPGIVAANISIFVGYKLRGKRGALISLIGIVTSPIISILIVATVLDKIMNLPFIQNIFWGVGIAVIILLYLSVKEMWQNSIKDIVCWIIFGSSFALSFFLDLSPVIILIGAIVFGITYKIIERKRNAS